MKAGETAVGRRIPDSEGGPGCVFAEGDYGRIRGEWHGRPPGHHLGSLKAHDVTEHEDGTITVSPSILIGGGGEPDSWHGYLERGVWRRID